MPLSDDGLLTTRSLLATHAAAAKVTRDEAAKEVSALDTRLIDARAAEVDAERRWHLIADALSEIERELAEKGVPTE